MRRRVAGFTLVEVLVVAGVLSLLGGLLVQILLESSTLWRRETARQDAWDDARTVIEVLRRDLEEVVAPGEEAGPPRGRLVCDTDDRGRVRLLLVRGIGPEAPVPLYRAAGGRVGARGVIDGQADGAEAEGLDLAPTGGLMEVLWLFDAEEGAGTTLRRAYRSPPGGVAGVAAPDQVGRVAALAPLAQPISDAVLHLELNFWGPHTADWEAPFLLAEEVARGERGLGPAERWDSTRGLDPAFPYYRGAGSLADARDDILPRRVQIVLVVADRGLGDTTLAAPVGADATWLPLVRTVGFPPAGWTCARVGAEWVRYEAKDALGLRVAPDGRGVRATLAEAHPAGTPVVSGRTYSVVVSMPAVREMVVGR